jgi:hypothetical protein
MSYCAFDEAFTGPVVSKKSAKARTVPPQLAGAPAPAPALAQGEVPEAMRGSTDQGMVGRLDSGGASQEFFPLPGETAEPEEWQKAFTLEGSNMPRPDGAVSVAGKPTLWRNVPVPATPAQTAAPIASEVGQRLDMLTRQLESLTAPTPMQSTAELFLFVAIGLLLLLAIDTLLRFATSMASKQQSGGGFRIGRGRGWRHFR